MLPPYSFMYESNPAAQDVLWANKKITYLRRDWRPVITSDYYRNMKAKLLSSHDLTKTVVRYFDDEDFVKNTVFRPLPVMEKPRNILIDQARETGIKPYINSVDPTAKKHKEQDLFRLQTKQAQESQINNQRAKIGSGVPFQMDDKEFNGNVPEFDKMGLNPQDQSDVAFFFDTYYKLNYEGYATSSVMAYLGVNRVEEDIPRYINDIMAVKVICKQDYISPANGQIVTKYLQPNQTYAIFGNNRDATDAAVRGWERQIPVQELLSLLGTAFNFERDWIHLINAINYGSNTTFSGFIKGGVNFNMLDILNPVIGAENINAPKEEAPANLLNYDDVFVNTYNYKVSNIIPVNMPAV